MLRRLVLVFGAAALICGTACDAPAGLSANGVGDAGQTERGRGVGQFSSGRADVAGTDIARKDAPWQYNLSYDILTLLPDGHTLLIGVPVPGPNQGWAKPQLRLTAHDVLTGKTTPLALSNVQRVNFAKDGKTGWLLVPVEPAGTALWRIDTATMNLTPVAQLPQRFTTLDVTPDDKWLVLSNVPKMAGIQFAPAGCDMTVPRDGQNLIVNGCQYRVVPVTGGEGQLYTAPEPLRDLDFSPVQGELILTWSKALVATMRFHQPAGVGLAAIVTETTMPNCADEVIIAPQQGLALLAPHSCAKDPISVVDLKSHAFVENLPGFGPVALVDGMAIGFTRQADMAQAWQFKQDQPFGMIRVDLKTLQWSVTGLGDHAPSYTPTPDGKHLLVWDTGYDLESPIFSRPAHLRRVQVADGQSVPFDNSTVRPGPFGWLPDGDMVTVSGGFVFRLRPALAEATWLPTNNEPVQLLRILGGGTELLLGENARPRIHRLTLATGKLVSTDLGIGAQLVDNALPPVPVEQQGWGALAIRDGGVVGLPACGSKVEGAAIAQVTFQRQVDGQWQSAPLLTHLFTKDDGGCVYQDSAPLHEPFPLHGRTLRLTPLHSDKAIGKQSPWVYIRPGDRIVIDRAAGATGAEPCSDGQPCAKLPLGITLLPTTYPTPKPGKAKVLGDFAGKAQIVIDVPGL